MVNILLWLLAGFLWIVVDKRKYISKTMFAFLWFALMMNLLGQYLEGL